MNKEYPSVFLPDKKIDLSNYLTEIIICNFLNWQKLPIPSSPFWQAAIANKSVKLDDLRKRYGMELAEIKNLQKVFSTESISQTFKELKPISVKQLKKENRSNLIYNLYINELAFQKQVKKVETTETVEYKATPSFANKKKAISL